MLRLAKLRSAFDYLVLQISLVKIVLQVGLFLEYNHDLIYLAPPLFNLFFRKVFGKWLLINFGLLSAKICPIPVCS